jgi:hypothetical protein
MLLGVFLTWPALVHGSEEAFITPANWGGTGLMEIPSARLLKENTFRFGVSQVHPYRYYYAAVGILKGLELEGRFTEVIGVKAMTSSYGNYRDKAFDVKYRLLPEDKWLPALAIGLNDPHGTRKYASQFLVASKRIFPFDFTVGFGNGRYGKKPLPPQGEGFKVEMFSDPTQWLKDSQPFWGIQFAPSPKYAFMVEYSPIKYHKQIYDPAWSKYFREPVSLKYNFGFRYKPYNWADIDVSYQRGEEFGINLSMNFDIGNPLRPIVNRPFIETPSDRRAPLEVRLVKALSASGFSNIAVDFAGADLKIEADNNKYFYTPKAIGVIMKLVNGIVPRGNGSVRIVIKEQGIPMVAFEILREDIADYMGEILTIDDLYRIARIDTAVKSTVSEGMRNRKWFTYGVKPAFRPYVNDPAGFFKYRLGIEGWGGFLPWKGATLLASVETFPLNTVSTTNQPLSRPVRSDLVPYLKENIILTRLQFEQIAKTDYSVYGRFAAGYLEVEYGGLDGEVAVPLFDGRVLVGLSGSVVKKRSVANPFTFKDDDWKSYYTPAFVNSRLNLPEMEMSLDVKAGNFLAGDKGVKVTVSKFIKGVTIGAWYTWTNTNIFSDPFNRGYHDKGVYVSIPMRLFDGSDSRTTYRYDITPWTRDVGQDIYHSTNLFDFIGRNLPIFLRKDARARQSN